MLRENSQLSKLDLEEIIKVVMNIARDLQILSNPTKSFKNIIKRKQLQKVSHWALTNSLI
jgi:hypothetical protein